MCFSVVFKQANFFVGLLGVAALCLSCTQRGAVGPERNTDPLFYVGEINKNLTEKIVSHRGQKTLFIISRGGYVKDAIEIAEMLRGDGWSVHISGDCSSACADILLLGAHKVSVMPGSFIGFHGDSLMKNYMYRSVSFDEKSNCFLDYQGREDALISKSGANRNFWMHQYDRLKPYNVYLSGDSKCRTLNYDLEVDFWYPNRKQLLSLYGIQVHGELAADNPSKYRDRIKKFQGYNDVIMIGDSIMD